MSHFPHEVGYCTNVHPGITLDAVLAQLEANSVAVRKSFCPTRPLGIGLWLGASTARELEDPDQMDRLADWLAENQLLPFTLNGFPFGDFHQPVVKRDVYRPDWSEESRLEYTLQLFRWHDRLLPPGRLSTVSTLPLGWSRPAEPRSEFFESCAAQLIRCARKLAAQFDATGREAILCLEPEPGCVLDTAADVIAFFERYLWPAAGESESFVRRHIGVCHDICHSAVMFEPQAAAIGAYASAGIRIGKIQVSSAPDVDFDALDEPAKQLAWRRLNEFNEPRYLHQTVIEEQGTTRFFEDLPDALNAAGGQPAGHWRVHFHVPLHWSDLNGLGTTQNEIFECLSALQKISEPPRHFEVETYAWNVLPSPQRPDLPVGIADELRWFADQLAAYPQP